MNKQPGTSNSNTDTLFTHSSAKIPRLEQDIKTESDDEDYLITIREEEPCEESINIESTPLPTFTIYENNVKVEPCLENNALITTFNFTKSKAWLMKRSINPMEYMNYFLDDNFLNSIVKATNHEAHLCQMLGFRSRLDWIFLTVSEFKIFIGLLLHTGTAKMNSLPEYWKTHRLSKSCFPDYMTLARFTAILQYLAIAEESAAKEPHEYKAVDHFNGVMNRYYVPGRNLHLSVNGIDTFTNSFTPDVEKTSALGINICALFEQGGPILKIATDVKACSTSDKETLFLTFLEEKLDCGHSLYVTPKLTIPITVPILLLKRKTYCNGILQPELSEHCPKGDDSENVHTGACIDTNGKTIYYISTEFKDTLESETKQAPQAIRNYMEQSKSSEFQDIRLYYPFGVTNFSQRNKVFIFILMASIKNASIAAGIDFNDYRFNVIENLLPAIEPCKEKNKHRLTRLPRHGDSLQGGRYDCYNCAMAKNVSRVTVYWCNKCENSPPLCVECFFEVHLED